MNCAAVVEGLAVVRNTAHKAVNRARAGHLASPLAMYRTGATARFRQILPCIILASVAMRIHPIRFVHTCHTISRGQEIMRKHHQLGAWLPSSLPDCDVVHQPEVQRDVGNPLQTVEAHEDGAEAAILSAKETPLPTVHGPGAPNQTHDEDDREKLGRNEQTFRLLPFSENNSPHPGAVLALPIPHSRNQDQLESNADGKRNPEVTELRADEVVFPLLHNRHVQTTRRFNVTLRLRAGGCHHGSGIGGRHGRRSAGSRHGLLS
mmetsp:Transcript_123135/g.292732  ORF Transcript_123135/g.292732 Transcript_123135/m.292732 type:complete len:263 (+) Transcript_123135:1631-2419(+)